MDRVESVKSERTKTVQKQPTTYVCIDCSGSVWLDGSARRYSTVDSLSFFCMCVIYTSCNGLLQRLASMIRQARYLQTPSSLVSRVRRPYMYVDIRQQVQLTDSQTAITLLRRDSFLRATARIANNA